MRVSGLALIGACAALAGCGGGSDGSQSGVMGFTGFTDLPEDGEVTLSGTSQTVPIAVTSPTTVVAGPLGPSTDAEAQIEQTNGFPSRIVLDDGTNRLVFDAASDSTITQGSSFIIAERDDGSFLLEVLDPSVSGFEYQTLGAWTSELVGLDNTIGVVNVGFETAPGDLPSGSASYFGESIGYVVLETGELGVAFADVNLSTADFRRVTFSSTGTFAGPLGSGPLESRPDLDLGGSLTVNGNGFSGAVSGAAVSGTASGRFYGPNAEEAGGVFGTSGAGGLTYIGSFGAAR